MRVRIQTGDAAVQVGSSGVSWGRGGLSLIQVLLITVAFAIFTTLVIPRFSVARDTARASMTKTQLKNIRKVLGLYKLHHHAVQYPTLAALQADWIALTQKTDLDGTITTAGIFGPYLRKAPNNVFTDSTRVVAMGMGTSEDGWEYNETTGTITAVGFNEVTDQFGL